MAAIDAVNAQDPNTEICVGERLPKELAHAQRASHWLETLDPCASEELRLAVRAHHLRRWALPRAAYPLGRVGYHAWRRELQNRHARECSELLSAVGYDAAPIERVSELIRKRRLGRDPQAQVYEDVLCLVFIELQLESFAAAHDAEKIVGILARTLPKMSERAIGLAAQLPTSTQTKELIGRAVQRAADEAASP
jgi:hypothetical protein